MPPCTATKAATRSATSRGRSRCACRRSARLGLDRIVDIGGPVSAEPPRAAIGRMAEASKGKDSVTGHWEMMGIVLDRPFPVFPNGFPKELIDAFEQRIGRGTLGNYAASGTAIIEDLGAEHMRTASRSSTPRPTACFRLPPTRT